MKFKVGEKVIYPNHGIALIEEITQHTIAGKEKLFYSLKVLANDSLVMVPTANVKSVGLRKIINKREVSKLFKILRNGNIETSSNWKGRFKENSTRMQSGSIYEAAEVLKSLFYLSQQKPLSYREKRMMERAKYLIISEIAEVKKQPTEKVEEKIEKALNASLKLMTEH